MKYQFDSQNQLVESVLKAFLCVKEKENRRSSFNFTTSKGTELGVSIQTGFSYSCEPKEMLYTLDAYKSVEVHNGNPNWIFSEDFISKYAEYADEPVDTCYKYVTIEDLAKEVVIAINTL